MLLCVQSKRVGDDDGGGSSKKARRSEDVVVKTVPTGGVRFIPRVSRVLPPPGMMFIPKVWLKNLKSEPL
jgi:hypothetical protein